MASALCQAAGLTTWFDEDRLRGDLNKQIAEGIAASGRAAILILPG